MSTGLSKIIPRFDDFSNTGIKSHVTEKRLNIFRALNEKARSSLDVSVKSAFEAFLQSYSIIAISPFLTPKDLGVLSNVSVLCRFPIRDVWLKLKHLHITHEMTLDRIKLIAAACPNIVEIDLRDANRQITSIRIFMIFPKSRLMHPSPYSNDEGIYLEHQEEINRVETHVEGCSGMMIGLTGVGLLSMLLGPLVGVDINNTVKGLFALYSCGIAVSAARCFPPGTEEAEALTIMSGSTGFVLGAVLTFCFVTLYGCIIAGRRICQVPKAVLDGGNRTYKRIIDRSAIIPLAIVILGTMYACPEKVLFSIPVMTNLVFMGQLYKKSNIVETVQQIIINSYKNR